MSIPKIFRKRTHESSEQNSEMFYIKYKNLKYISRIISRRGELILD